MDKAAIIQALDSMTDAEVFDVIVPVGEKKGWSGSIGVKSFADRILGRSITQEEWNQIVQNGFYKSIDVLCEGIVMNMIKQAIKQTNIPAYVQPAFEDSCGGDCDCDDEDEDLDEDDEDLDDEDLDDDEEIEALHPPLVEPPVAAPAIVPQADPTPPLATGEAPKDFDALVRAAVEKALAEKTRKPKSKKGKKPTKSKKPTKAKKGKKPAKKGKSRR